ncbi:hypothetical protein ACFLY0_00620 [Patescibacteria group bacterium]
MTGEISDTLFVPLEATSSESPVPSVLAPSSVSVLTGSFFSVSVFLVSTFSSFTIFSSPLSLASDVASAKI